MTRLSRTLVGLGLAAVGLLMAACAPKPAAPAPAAKAEIGAWGVDLAAGKPEIRAGDDFFAHANGTWLASYEIPADRASYGMFDRLDELSRTRLREIIEAKGAAGAAAGTIDQKVGDFYASFMDEARIESLGLAPLRADLERIAAARTPGDLSALFGAPGLSSPFGLGVWEDLKTPTQATVYINQSGLGLPDRDYYLKQDAKFAGVRAAYEAYLAQLLALAGEPAARTAARAKAVMALETRIARAHWPAEETRDIDRVYNPRTRAGIKAFAPGVDWDAFLAAAELGRRDAFVLGEMSALKATAALVRGEPVEVWQDYLRVHLLSDHARYLPRAFDEARFAFYGRTLRGQKEQQARWKRGVDLVDSQVGEAVGKVYVEKYFPPEAKAKMELLVANLLAALRDRMETLAWMTPETRARALAKLATFDPKIGYPDRFRDYADLEIRRDDLIGNVRRAVVSNWRYEIGKLDRPVDRREWAMTPQTVNAYYNPTKNEIVFPAAILQPPFFDPAADDAVNYGAIGAVIGHEIGHGFDDQGAKFDGEGKLADWWSDADRSAFEARGRTLVAQYGAYEPLPGLKVNGQLTLGENIGDLGGVNMAYHAYRMSLNGGQAPVLDGLTGDQRFFLSWAQVWRSKFREEALREQVLSDPHSPAQYRVNAVVRNVDAWYAAFGVREGDALYLKPGDRVSIW